MLLDLGELAAAVAQMAGHVGSPAAHEALALYVGGSAGTRTATEDRFLEVVAAAGLPMPIVNTAGATGVSPEELDFVWPDARLVLEIDGDTIHDRPSVERRDALRDAHLAAARWTCVRVPPRRVWRDPAGLVRELERHGVAPDPART